MNYEKKYKETLEKAKAFLKRWECVEEANSSLVLEEVKNIFPELKELEDEKIRKALIEYFGEQCYMSDWNGVYGYQVLAWLEKQGKQNPANKVEPKFKVGDWIVDKSGFVLQVLDFSRGIYICDYSCFSTSCESNYHLWTIADAKDGDVLVCPKYAGDIIPNIFIFKNIKTKDNDVFCYCSFLETFRIEGYIANADPINTDFYPATKEQRNLLFQKIHEAGYEWDSKKERTKKGNY